VTSKAAVEAAIGKLATTMRHCIEAHGNFEYVFSVDQEEAINNLEHAFENKLEAFHTLYDVSKSLFAYQGYGDTAFIIALRNAIHHRDHALFRSFRARIFLDDTPQRWNGAAFLLARHTTTHGGSIGMSHFLRLDDIDARLNPDLGSPALDAFAPKKAKARFQLIDGELNLAELRMRGVGERYPADQVYLDAMPIFVSAVCRVFKALKSAGMAFKGFDAEAYEGPFTDEIDVDLQRLEFRMNRVLT
jgi:hypothetical protein